MNQTAHNNRNMELEILTELKKWGSIVEAGKETSKLASKTTQGIGMSTENSLSGEDRSGAWQFREVEYSHNSVTSFEYDPRLDKIRSWTKPLKKPEAGTSKEPLRYETLSFRGGYSSETPSIKRDRKFFLSVDKGADRDHHRYYQTMFETDFHWGNFRYPRFQVSWASVLDRFKEDKDDNYFSWTAYHVTDNKGDTLVLAAVNSEGVKYLEGYAFHRSANPQAFLDALRAPSQILVDTLPSKDSAPTA